VCICDWDARIAIASCRILVLCLNVRDGRPTYYRNIRRPSTIAETYVQISLCCTWYEFRFNILCVVWCRHFCVWFEQWNWFFCRCKSIFLLSFSFDVILTSVCLHYAWNWYVTSFFHKILHDYSSRRAGTIRAAQKIHRPPLDCGMVDEVGDYQAPATLVDHY